MTRWLIGVVLVGLLLGIGWPARAADKVFRNFDAKGLRPPLTITPEDHGGGQLLRVGQWDGAGFVKVADWKAPYQDVVAEEVKKGAEEFRRTGK